MLPMLIVCYLRPRDLETILEKNISSGRKIYVFIDRCHDKNKPLNEEVIKLAEKYEITHKIKVKVSEVNFGVGRAVPAAVNWIAENENYFIILEDDCHLNSEGYKFLDKNALKLNHEISVICATSPWDLEINSEVSNYNSLSSYPLISGWATSSKCWSEISFLIGKKPPVMLTLTTVLKRPRKILVLCFFLAAHIRVHRGRSKAWDCSLALGMLIRGKKALIPNLTMVTNTGRDEVASHTIREKNQDSIFRKESSNSPSKVLNESLFFTNKTDKQIEEKLYRVKKRHLLSPFKAYLI
jgi:hypothetical protein